MDTSISNYKVCGKLRSSNGSITSVSSKRSKYDVEKYPLVIHAKEVLTGLNQLAALQRNMKKAQDELNAHDVMHKQTDLVGLQVEVQHDK